MTPMTLDRPCEVIDVEDRGNNQFRELSARTAARLRLLGASGGAADVGGAVLPDAGLRAIMRASSIRLGQRVSLEGMKYEVRSVTPTTKWPHRRFVEVRLDLLRK